MGYIGAQWVKAIEYQHRHLRALPIPDRAARPLLYNGLTMNNIFINKQHIHVSLITYWVLKLKYYRSSTNIREVERLWWEVSPTGAKVHSRFCNSGHFWGLNMSFKWWFLSLNRGPNHPPYLEGHFYKIFDIFGVPVS